MQQPQAVVKAAKAADALHAQVYKNTETDPPAGEEASPVTPETPSAEQVAAPAKPPTQGAADWEHKYNTLRGIFNKEVPRLNGIINGLRDEVATLNAALDKMRQQAPQLQGQAFLSNEDVEEYGEEMLGTVKRAALEAVAPHLAALEEKNKQLEAENLQLQRSLSTVKATTTVSAKQGMFDTLTAALPDWQAINSDPKFLEWLSTVDPMFGASYQDMLDAAVERVDTPRVLAFFERYINENNLVSRRSQDQMTARTPSVSLDNLVAPGKPSRGTAPTPPIGGDTEVWSTAKINAFYADCARGKYANNPKQKAVIEQRIHRAAAEGRVRN